MKNLGLLTAGIVGAAVLTVGAGYALSNGAGPKPVYTAELAGDAPEAKPAGMTEAEMEARIADERAAAQARADAKIACERERQEASNRGAVIGGVTGAVIGSQVAGSGAKSEGGVIGGVAGVMVGRDLAKKDHRC